MSATDRITLYYDVISPFAYLAIEQLDKLPKAAEITLKPVLFAGLLKHWDNKGPAEIAGQRLFTYRYCHWLAGTLNIPYRMPDKHPFNPLPALRLALCYDNQPDVVRAIFGYIWRDGNLPSDRPQWDRFTQQLIDLYGEPPVSFDAAKQQLRDNTEEAVEHQVFGVPTFEYRGELFFGQDAMPFLTAYIDDDALLYSPAMTRISGIDEEVRRR